MEPQRPGAPCVIVTRPAREAVRWVQALRAAGIDARALPLIAIEPLPAPLDQPARDAWDHIHGFSALMFVSAAAVEHFFALAPGRVLPEAVRCWAPGPGTARALAAAGVPAGRIDTPPPDDGRFDSEALWSRVAAQVRPGTRVLLVRGADAQGQPAGRAWLAGEIAAAGGAGQAVASYRRLPPTLDAAGRQLAARGERGDALWLFSSSEAVANLRQALPAARWDHASALATHPRIAQAARDAGFARVAVSPPAPEALVASIESFQ